MARSLYISLIYLAYLVLGVSAPFVFSLGYVWVDSFDPQDVVYYFLNQIPVSMIMALAAVGGFLALDRRKGRVTALSIVLAIFAVWVTTTTAFFAVSPVDAWPKWDWAFKTICFAAFVPFVFRSRVQIEALMHIYLFSILVHFLPIGVKTLVSGGGYGRALGVINGTSLLAEGSTLAGVALMLVPIIVYIAGNSILLPPTPWTRLGFAAIGVTAVSAAIGTFERTGLVGIAVAFTGLWLRTRRKFLFGVLGIVGVLVVGSVTSDQWTERISTIQDYSSEKSALGRILAWKWTLGFVATHPFGGGFNAYVVDQIEFPPDANGNAQIRKGIAFHSIYFEVLGEQGYPGLGLFGAIIGLSFFSLYRVTRLARGSESLVWAREMAYALMISLTTLLVCGAFVGIAFQPMFYYLFAMSACLREHVKQLERRGCLVGRGVALALPPPMHAVELW